MKKRRNKMPDISDVIERMQLDKKNFSSHIVDFSKINYRRSSGIPRIEFEVNTPIGPERRTYLLSIDAYSGICAYANPKLTSSLLNEIGSDDIAELVMNNFLSDIDQGIIQLITGTSKESTDPVIVSLIRADQIVIPDLDIYDSVSSIAEVNGVQLDDFIETSQGHIMRFITDQSDDVRPGVGDIVQSGFEVFNSPKGLAPCSVSSYLKRLICLNGQTRSEVKIKTRAAGVDKASILNMIRDSVSIECTKFNEDILRIKNLVVMEVPNPEAMIRSVATEFGIPGRDTELALQALSEEPEISNTMWGVLNSFTRVGNNNSLPWEARQKLQRVGYSLIDKDIERCDSCGSLHVGNHSH
jgi:hypothetical protein